LAAADLNGNGTVIADEAAQILRVSVWLETLEDVAGGADQIWRFLPGAHAYPAVAEPMAWDFQAAQAGDVSGNWALFAPGALAAATTQSPLATFVVEARAAGAGVHDLVLTLATVNAPVESADLVLFYDPVRLEVLSAGAAPGANVLAAANTAEPGVVRIGLAGVAPLAVGAPVATLRVRAQNDPLAALSSIQASVNEGPALVHPWAAMPYHIYLPAVVRR
jgi:hypothetical protein